MAEDALTRDEVAAGAELFRGLRKGSLKPEMAIYVQLPESGDWRYYVVTDSTSDSPFEVMQTIVDANTAPQTATTRVFDSTRVVEAPVSAVPERHWAAQDARRLIARNVHPGDDGDVLIHQGGNIVVYVPAASIQSSRAA